ncbi:MAG TPA: FAD-dependent oxidoreductase [Candidatus Acidoferrales bacterium]|jgi:thioredoxin reductase (NADPH)|nr:FAD-dependent oxidoreductase [Candidatus Acidoferrales bacterium]
MSFTDIPLLGPRDEVFPTLSDAQIERIKARGRVREVSADEVLIEQGEATVPFFVNLSSELEAVRPTELGKRVITLSGRGQFTGEINTLSGRQTMFRIKASKPGEVIELDRHQMMALVQGDAEIGEIVVRAFILRRAGLVSGHIGDVVLVGSAHSADTLRLKEFLMRNGHPYAYLDLERDTDAEQLMTSFNIVASDIPVVICRGKNALRNPSNRELADCLGFNESIDEARVRDVVVIGAGPSGLAAAVYGASEGLDVLVIETNAPGGQAGSSSRIENYLGFPTGISGLELAERAYTQAERFGAELLMDRAVGLECDRKPYHVRLESGGIVATRTIVVASGVRYRKPALENLERFEGNGIYYGATYVESQLCGGEEVVVVGGGNSAGQAAVFLSEAASRVYVLVRSAGLAESMSRYLSLRIEQTPNIQLLTETEIVALLGDDDRLQAVRWRNNRTGVVEEHPIGHVFMMTGAAPNAAWLAACAALDEKGFVKTGPQLSPEDLAAARWPLLRQPFLFETSLPGVFAVGDVRGGSVKRVASAVGEGSVAISFVHQVLSQ